MGKNGKLLSQESDQDAYYSVSLLVDPVWCDLHVHTALTCPDIWLAMLLFGQLCCCLASYVAVWPAMLLCCAAGDLACCGAKPLPSLSGHALCYAAPALLF